MDAGRALGDDLLADGSHGILAGWRRPLPWPVFVLLLLPIAVDGFSHMFGWRETNAWFDSLTGGRFGAFSLGDSVGSLNWWLRIVTGSVFGWAVVRFTYPWIDWLVSPPMQRAGGRNG